MNTITHQDTTSLNESVSSMSSFCREFDRIPLMERVVDMSSNSQDFNWCISLTDYQDFKESVPLLNYQQLMENPALEDKLLKRLEDNIAAQKNPSKMPLNQKLKVIIGQITKATFNNTMHQALVQEFQSRIRDLEEISDSLKQKDIQIETRSNELSEYAKSLIEKLCDMSLETKTDTLEEEMYYLENFLNYNKGEEELFDKQWEFWERLFDEAWQGTGMTPVKVPIPFKNLPLEIKNGFFFCDKK